MEQEVIHFFCFFAPFIRLRQFCYSLVCSRTFQTITYAAVFLSSALLALEMPIAPSDTDEDDPLCIVQVGWVEGSGGGRRGEGRRGEGEERGGGGRREENWLCVLLQCCNSSTSGSKSLAIYRPFD